MLTAEEWEEKKKREEELQWKRILMYYMIQEYVIKPQAQAEAELRSAYLATSQYVKERGLLNRLLEKEGKGPSAVMLLSEIGKDEPPESPFGELWCEIQKGSGSEEKLTKAIARVVNEEPPRMIADAQKEHDRHAKWKRTHARKAKAADSFELIDGEHVRYEERLSKKMAFLRVVMPPELYRELEHRLEEGEYTIDPHQPREQQPEHKPDYRSYVEKKRVEPEEKAGKLANAGDVYSAAAYMLAAWEQRNAKDFDEAKADARAMELSGSRAFKAYLKGHPGNLLAAARGSAVEETYNGVAALNADLSRRDAILTNTRDSLKKLATGKTPCFHRMLNALDRFVNADTEPSQEEKAGLVTALAEYITTDCSPQSREFNRDCFTEAMRSVRALVPEKDFEKIVEQVNVDREPKVKTADFDAETSSVKETIQKEPTRERRCDRECNTMI